MHDVINRSRIKLTSDDVQQNCAKCTKPLPFLALRQRLPTLSPTGTNPRISEANNATLEYYNPSSASRPNGFSWA